jgi:hypothetical protein
MALESLPVLARGKHRNPRKGACFMEFASLLAGERWSDHPRCTHPLLGALARSVNDCTTDEGRPQLATLIPDVIGTEADDPRLAPELVLLTCRRSLPYVRGHPRFVLGVALLSAERQLREVGAASPETEPDPLTAAERADAAAYVDRFRVSPRFYRRKGALGVLQYAVGAVALERSSRTDAVLREMLAAAVHRYHEVVPGRRQQDAAERWAAACAVVGTTE